MKLWLITQTENEGIDTYESAVVAAATDEDAKRTHPSGYSWNSRNHERRSWATDPNRVSAELIGEAVEGTEPGVICASFIRP